MNATCKIRCITNIIEDNKKNWERTIRAGMYEIKYVTEDKVYLNHIWDTLEVSIDQFNLCFDVDRR